VICRSKSHTRLWRITQTALPDWVVKTDKRITQRSIPCHSMLNHSTERVGCFEHVVLFTVASTDEPYSRVLRGVVSSTSEGTFHRLSVPCMQGLWFSATSLIHRSRTLAEPTPTAGLAATTYPESNYELFNSALWNCNPPAEESHFEGPPIASLLWSGAEAYSYPTAVCRGEWVYIFVTLLSSPSLF
jgi:hypothetical protein